MNLAIRDDDLNYFFTPDEIELNYQNIWNICPISMSVVPYIKGNWKRNVVLAEKRGPGKNTLEELNRLKQDNFIYPIGDNIPLVDYVREKISEGKIYLSIHGIHHRNEDEIPPQFDTNFGMGAEFYTDRDLTFELRDAISYIEDLFHQKIVVFCPSQNLYSDKGLQSVINNNLMICGPIPFSRKHFFTCIKRIGISNFFRLQMHKMMHSEFSYPHSIQYEKLNIIGFSNLRPNSDIKQIKRTIDHCVSTNGSFVLATHSYAFDYKMNNSTMVMREALREIIEYAKEQNHINFVPLNEVF